MRRPLIATCLLIAIPAAAAHAAPGDDPLQASDNAVWSTAQAAHLLRRAGFGGPPAQIRHLTQLGRDPAVDLLLHYETTPQDHPDFPVENMPDRPPLRMFADLSEDERRQLRQMFQRLGVGYQASLQDWWLQRMVATSRPLEEKMTLFWHGLLTSGFREVREPRSLYRQNAFLREHALADFRTILRGISRDRAMLLYLDGAKNVKQHPNENYARELMELFTMGVGNYTEQDVKEAARAFTGWTCDESGRFDVRQREHDGGEKTFLGRTGRFDGDDIIDIILEQPATSRYLARRLLTFFVEPEPADDVIDALAGQLRRSDYRIRDAMSTLLRSNYFYAKRVRFALIKSPAELVVGSARLLETPICQVRAAHQQMAQMGQELFQPPNVKGWDGGRAWINTSTLFIRYNTVAGLLNGVPGRGPGDRMARLADRLADIGIGTGSSRSIAVADLSEKKAGDPDPGDAMMMMSAEEEERLDEMGAIVKKLPERAQEWLRSVQLPPRYNAPQPEYDPMPVLREHKLTRPEAVVDHYVRRLLQTELPKERKQVLVQALLATGGGFDVNDPALPRRIRAMIHLIMSMPEYQLN